MHKHRSSPYPDQSHVRQFLEKTQIYFGARGLVAREIDIRVSKDKLCHTVMISVDDAGFLSACALIRMGVGRRPSLSHACTQSCRIKDAPFSQWLEQHEIHDELDSLAYALEKLDRLGLIPQLHEFETPSGRPAAALLGSSCREEMEEACALLEEMALLAHEQPEMYSSEYQCVSSDLMLKGLTSGLTLTASEAEAWSALLKENRAQNLFNRLFGWCYWQLVRH